MWKNDRGGIKVDSRRIFEQAGGYRQAYIGDKACHRKMLCKG
nr:MAG TPA: hypothetical protein [Caudoviricetes sp.]